MVEILVRDTDTGRVSPEGFLDWDSLAAKAAEIWLKECGIKGEVKDVEVLQRGFKPQVSINSDGRIVIRLIPWLRLAKVKLKGGAEEEPHRTVYVPDSDVLIVLDFETSRTLYKFLRTVSVDNWYRFV